MGKTRLNKDRVSERESNITFYPTDEVNAVLAAYAAKFPKSLGMTRSQLIRSIIVTYGRDVLGIKEE